MNDDPKRKAGDALGRDVLDRDRRHVWHPFTQHGTEGDPIVLTGAKGASLFDAAGHEILDLVSSWWTCTHGHSHPKINAALAKQASLFEHVMFAGFTHQPAVDLATKSQGFFPTICRACSSPTTARPPSRSRSRSPINIGSMSASRGGASWSGFDGGYHGDTLGAMSLGRGSQFFTPFRDLMCKVYVLPYPSTFDGDDAADEREAGALSAFEALLSDRGQTIAALIIEPLMQGAGGMRVCRPSFLQRLTTIGRKAGALVIFDEVATGFGRTGTLFAMEQACVVPDLVCLSKGLTAGYMPLAMTVAREAIFEAFLGDSFDRALPHGHSFTANPLACAVGLASLALFEEEKTLKRIARINSRHRAMLAELAARDDVTRPRLLGSILAFDIKAADGYQSAQSRALAGLVSRPRAQYQAARTTLYLMPPYCITDEELARAYAGMIEGLDTVGA